MEHKELVAYVVSNVEKLNVRQLAKVIKRIDNMLLSSKTSEKNQADI